MKLVPTLEKVVSKNKSMYADLIRENHWIVNSTNKSYGKDTLVRAALTMDALAKKLGENFGKFKAEALMEILVFGETYYRMNRRDQQFAFEVLPIRDS